jgi:predicted RNA-binding Zn-ribbon protein involved in translation (DUF1610 family)
MNSHQLKPLTCVADVGPAVRELLKGVARFSPSCPSCGWRIESGESAVAYVRLDANGRAQQQCRRCFVGDVAEQLMGMAPA